MTKQEAIQGLQEKGDQLITYFAACPGLNDMVNLPIKQAHTILNAGKFVYKQICVMNAHRDNPFHRLYVNGYHQLSELKMYIEKTIENAKPAKPDVQPAPKRRTGKKGNTNGSLFLA